MRNVQQGNYKDIAEAMDAAVEWVKREYPAATNITSDCDNNDGEVIFNVDDCEITLRVKPHVGNSFRFLLSD